MQIDAIERYTNGAIWADIARRAKLKIIEGLQKKLGVVNEDVDLNEALEAGISEGRDSITGCVRSWQRDHV